MKPIALTGGVVGIVILLGGCASTPDGGARRLTGVSGPIEWEIIDIGHIETPDRMLGRWSYTIVLREKAGKPIELERIDRSAYSHNLEVGGITTTTFQRRLEANSELRYSAVDYWGWVRHAQTQFGGMARLGSLRVERRFVGKDVQGRAVEVPVRVVVDREVGKGSRQPQSSEQVTPPVRRLEDGDLRKLAGLWKGYVQIRDFQVPVEVSLKEDGSAEIAENDPVTNRFRARVSVGDGRLWYSGNDTGELVFHEGGGRRVLAGQVSSPATGAAPPIVYPLRIEAARETERAATVGTSESQVAVSRIPTSPVNYKGVVSTEEDGHLTSLRVSFTVVRNATEISGSWISEDARMSGALSGTFIEPSRANIRLTQQHPCLSQFSGTATLSTDGSTLGGAYSGHNCAGRPLKATFTAVRQ